MSKSKGNVYCPSDLLVKGFSGRHLRFFLIYGPYRKKLNFTFKRLSQVSQRLDSFRSMVADLEKTLPTSQPERQEKLTNKITIDFEDNMDNDLDVKSAFDSLYETTAKLHKIRQSLGTQDVKNVLDSLRTVDRVLQCILKGD